jgi:hypothetical protein
MVLAVALAGTLGTGDAQAAVDCASTITANVVVLDNPTVFNRLGAQNPNWITYALRRDVIDVRTGTPEGIANDLGEVGVLEPGFVALRPDKRTRPLVVRSVAGACLTVNFENLLDPIPNNKNPIQDLLDNNDQVAGRCAGFHASGVELRSIGGGIANDGSFVGNNHSGDDVANNCGLDGGIKGSLVSPGDNTTYNLYTPHEGAFVINSYGATLGSEQSSGNLGIGMFGQLNVEPRGARGRRRLQPRRPADHRLRGGVPRRNRCLPGGDDRRRRFCSSHLRVDRRGPDRPSLSLSGHGNHHDHERAHG